MFVEDEEKEIHSWSIAREDEDWNSSLSFVESFEEVTEEKNWSRNDVQRGICHFCAVRRRSWHWNERDNVLSRRLSSWNICWRHRIIPIEIDQRSDWRSEEWECHWETDEDNDWKSISFADRLTVRRRREWDDEENGHEEKKTEKRNSLRRRELESSSSLLWELNRSVGRVTIWRVLLRRDRCVKEENVEWPRRTNVDESIEKEDVQQREYFEFAFQDNQNKVEDRVIHTSPDWSICWPKKRLDYNEDQLEYSEDEDSFHLSTNHSSYLLLSFPKSLVEVKDPLLPWEVEEYS